jgi:hypothetical protein
MAEQAAADRSADAIDDGDEDSSELVLQYNTVRAYISAINELWEHQAAQKLYCAPRPYRVAIKVNSPPLSTGIYTLIYYYRCLRKASLAASTAAAAKNTSNAPLMILYIGSTRRTVASRPDDRLLSYHFPSRLYAGSRRLRS